MMNKSSVKKLLVAITLIAVVAIFATNVQATGIVNPLNIQGTTTNTTTNTTTTNTLTSNTVKGNTTTNTTANTTTNTVSNYQNSNLPQTGDASDYALFLIIAVGIVVAIFAYRKIKYYNM